MCVTEKMGEKNRERERENLALPLPNAIIKDNQSIYDANPFFSKRIYIYMIIYDNLPLQKFISDLLLGGRATTSAGAVDTRDGGMTLARGRHQVMQLPSAHHGGL